MSETMIASTSTAVKTQEAKKPALPPMPDLAERLKRETIVPWTEQFKPNGFNVTFDGESYINWTRSLIPEPLRSLKPGEKHPLGELFFRWRQLNPFHMALSGWFGLTPSHWVRSYLEMGPRRGKCAFSCPVWTPQICRRDSWEDSDIVMSLTPMEVLTQMPGLRKTRGKVLVGGLGIGWFLRRTLERKQVDEVTLYDTNKDIVDAFGAQFKDHPKLKGIITESVWQADPSKFDSIALDIWDGYGTASIDRKLREWKKIHPRVWGWGDVETLD